MTEKERVLEIDNELAVLDLYQERAQYIQGEMSQEYFNLSDPNLINYYHNNARIQCDIALDYICRMSVKVESINKIIADEHMEELTLTKEQESIELIVKLLDRMDIKTLERIYNYVNNIFVGRGGIDHDLED